METKHLAFGHETSVIILVGMLISFIVYEDEGDSFSF